MRLLSRQEVVNKAVPNKAPVSVSELLIKTEGNNTNVLKSLTHITEIRKKLQEKRDYYEVLFKKMDADYLAAQRDYQSEHNELIASINTLKEERDKALEPVLLEKQRVARMKEEIELYRKELGLELERITNETNQFEKNITANKLLVEEAKKEQAKAENLIKKAQRKLRESDKVIQAHHEYIEKSTADIKKKQAELNEYQKELSKKEVMINAKDSHFSLREKELEARQQLITSREARLKIAFDELRTKL